MSDGLFMGGTRLWQRDQAELQQMAANTALLRERTQNEVADRELNPLRAKLLEGQATHQGTLADLNRAQAGAIEAKESREDRVAAAIASSMGKRRKPAPVEFDGEGNPMPQAEEEGQGIADLASVGRDVMAAGDLAKGEKLIKLAADLKQKEAATKASEAAAKLRATNMQIKKLDFMREVFSGVKDPASHARALLLLQGNTLTADEPVPAALQKYDPVAIGQFLSGSKVAVDKKRLEIASFNASSADTARKAAQATREYLAELAERRTKAYVERAANGAKAGGVEKTVPMPSSAEVRMIREQLADEDIEFAEDDDNSVLELAEQVKILTARNTSLSRTEAIAKVVADAKARGDLTPGERRMILPNKKAGYKQTEGSVAMPMPLPSDVSALKEGNYYRADTGEIRQYKGGTFVPISKAAPKPGKGK